MTTTEIPAEPEQATPSSSRPAWLDWLLVAGLIYLLICAVSMIGGGFKSATKDEAEELFAFATNPFMGLIIGTVATALIQSSSTVTSIIVALVAGGLPVTLAVPMVMGANIGTTITNTIVSLGHVRDKNEFRRAFAAATVHDYFNLLSVVIFLPLEIAFGILEKIGGYLATMMVGGAAVDVKSVNYVKAATKFIVDPIKHGTHDILPEPFGGIAMIIIGVVLIFVSIMFIGKLLKVLMVGRAKQILHTAIGRGPVTGIGSGTLMTVLVQSSSTTTSLMVPLAGTGVFSLRDIYPFTLGANIGTCITALLAATAFSGDGAVFALQIALIHMTYNILGVVVIYGIPFLRELPIKGAEWLARISAEQKLYAAAYIVCVFFIVPLICVGLTQVFDGGGTNEQAQLEQTQPHEGAQL